MQMHAAFRNEGSCIGAFRVEGRLHYRDQVRASRRTQLARGGRFYWLQVEDNIRTDWTRTRCGVPVAEVPVEVEPDVALPVDPVRSPLRLVPDVDPLPLRSLSSVPVISTRWPACSESSELWPSRMYDDEVMLF